MGEKCQTIFLKLLFLFIFGLSSLADARNHGHAVGIGAVLIKGEGETYTNPAVSYQWRTNDMYAMELILGGGGSDAEVDIDVFGGTRVKIGGRIDNVNLYVSGAYYNVSVSGYGQSADGSGAAGGVGAEININRNLFVNIHLEKGFGDFEDADFATLSLMYRF